MLFGSDDAAGEIGFAELFGGGFHFPFLAKIRGFFELRFRGFLPENLTDLEIANQAIAHPHGHGAIAQADRTGDGLSLVGGLLAEAFLHLQTSGAGAVLPGHEGAERVFVAFAVVWQLPRFHGLERHGQAGEVAEGAFVVAIDAGIGEGFDKSPVILAIFVRFARCKVCERDRRLASVRCLY